MLGLKLQAAQPSHYPLIATAAISKKRRHIDCMDQGLYIVLSYIMCTSVSHAMRCVANSAKVHVLYQISWLVYEAGKIRRS